MVALAASASLRILSFNLRYDSQPDNATVKETVQNLPDPLLARTSYYKNTGERPWSARRIAVANEILFNKVDLIGFQETLKRQVDDLQELLGSNWGHVGVGRDDGQSQGEFSPIFYNKSALELVTWDTFWLSHTPFQLGSRYPRAGSVRICTVAHFKTSVGLLTAMATHWDDQSDAQRQLAASLILHRARHEASRSNCPVILLGDFNSSAFGRDNSGYKIITGAMNPVDIAESFRNKFPTADNSKSLTMIDLMGEAPRERVSGNYATYTAFAPVGNSSYFTRIDFIMGGSNRGWEVESYRIGQSLYDDGMYESDHRPVFTDIKLLT